MNAVIEHGTPLVDDPERVGLLRQLGVDETSFLRANRWHSTVYATGLVNLEERIVIDIANLTTVSASSSARRSGAAEVAR